VANLIGKNKKSYASLQILEKVKDFSFTSSAIAANEWSSTSTFTAISNPLYAGNANDYHTETDPDIFKKSGRIGLSRECGKGNHFQKQQYMETPETKQLSFTDQDIQNFSAFSVVLKRIHTRLMSEGYTIVDGKMLNDGVGDFSRGCDSVGSNQENHEK
jgi:hypothetical protein